jgi:hypothetical protein
MPSAYADVGTHRPCMVATCWAQGVVGSPTIPARVMSQDTQALLDTGSVVTLLRPELAGGKGGDPMEVACIHGETRTYGSCHVVIRTPYGVFTAWAGIVPHLPVPLLIGRDCPIFHRLWDPERENRVRREPARRAGRKVRPAYGAIRIPATQGEASAEDTGPEGDGPSPPGSPTPSGGRASGPQRPGPDTSDTLTTPDLNDPPEDAESSPLTELSDFLPEGGVGTTRPGQFASAQLQDDALKHAWSHVLAHDGQTRDSVSCLPHPHFSTRGALLYRVVERDGAVTEQLVVPRTSARCCIWPTHTSWEPTWAWTKPGIGS